MTSPESSPLTPSQQESYHKNGYLIIKNFLSKDKIHHLRQEIRRIHDFEERRDWKIAGSGKEASDSSRLIISAHEDQSSHTHDFFTASSDSIRWFLEKDASKVDPNQDPIWKYNKVGHALHDKSESFKAVSYQKRIHDIAKQVMHYKEPTIVQSMYIFKPPRVGGEVTPHQDDTFLASSDENKPCIGFWMALEDAHEQNACLWAIPGSHHDPTKQRWALREKLSQEEKQKYNVSDEATEDESEPLVFITRNPKNPYFTPEQEKNYIPLEVKAGDLILLHGRVVHQSHPNHSSESRECYTVHLVDRGTFCDTNWLQRSDGFPTYWETGSATVGDEEAQ